VYSSRRRLRIASVALPMALYKYVYDMITLFRTVSFKNNHL